MVPTYTGQHITEKQGYTSIPRAGFEPTIPVFERSKIIRAPDHAATGGGVSNINIVLIILVIAKSSESKKNMDNNNLEDEYFI
jgi:hypothetical protein